MDRRRKIAFWYLIALFVLLPILLFQTIGLYLSLGQPETTFSTIVVSPYPNCPSNSLPCDLGNITVSVRMVTNNPAGVSAGSPLTAFVSIRLSNNLTSSPSDVTSFGVNLTGTYGVSWLGFPNGEPSSVIWLSTPTYCHVRGGSDCGYLWTGNERVSYASYGEQSIRFVYVQYGGGIILEHSSDPFIQVSPPITTLQYLNSNVSIALEVIVILLITFEIVKDLFGKDVYKPQAEHYDTEY